MKKISLYLDEHLWHQFRLVCLHRHTSASQVVSGLLAEQIGRWTTEDETYEATVRDAVPQRKKRSV